MYLDGGDVLRARTVILATGVTWRRLEDRRLRPADRQGRLLRRVAQRGGEHARAGRHLVGAGNSAGQAALYFANHARTVTLLVPRRLAREEHVAVPGRAGRGASRTSPSRCGAEVAAVARRGAARGDRDPRPRERGRRAGTSAAASSSSSAPTPTPTGCRRRWRATRAATC